MASWRPRTLHTPSGDPKSDPDPSQPKPLLSRILGLVCLQLLRTLSGSAQRTLDQLHGLQARFHHLAVMDVGCRDGHRQRDAVLVHPKMALRPLLAAIRRIRPGRFVPPGAGTVAEPSKPATSRWCPLPQPGSAALGANASKPPACCHDLTVRRQVMPLSQPISLGNISPGMPVIRTNKIPIRTFRSGMSGRPLWAWAWAVAGAAGSVPQVHPRQSP